jgi:hypothetical protein
MLFTLVTVTATFINVMLTDHATAVAKLATTPLKASLPFASAALSPFSLLSSQIPSSITKAPETAVAVTGSPSRNVAHMRLKSGYVAAKGTALATPTEFKPIMYKVSPIPKPTTPLTTVMTTTPVGKLAKAPALPNANNRNNSTAALLTQRTIFAETGFALNKARLYNIGATAQHIAAPKAANSPSTTALIVKPLKNSCNQSQI